MSFLCHAFLSHFSVTLCCHICFVTLFCHAFLPRSLWTDLTLGRSGRVTPEWFYNTRNAQRKRLARGWGHSQNACQRNGCFGSRRGPILGSSDVFVSRFCVTLPLLGCGARPEWPSDPIMAVNHAHMRQGSVWRGVGAIRRMYAIGIKRFRSRRGPIWGSKKCPRPCPIRRC